MCSVARYGFVYDWPRVEHTLYRIATAFNMRFLPDDKLITIKCDELKSFARIANNVANVLGDRAHARTHARGSPAFGLW